VSLTTRLSAFFLTALAVVLVGFSATLYLLSQNHLYRQLDHRLDSALETLGTVVESEPDGLDWEPDEHHLTLGQDAGEDQVRWIVRDENGDLVGASPNLPARRMPFSPPSPGEGDVRRVEVADGQPWRILQRTVHAQPPEAPARGARPPLEGKRYPSLVLTGTISQAPVAAALRQLVWTLAALSGGLWLTAALLGRWLTRRAIAPVSRMAVAARAMTAADWTQRLPCPESGDELENLSRAFNDLLTRLHEAYERQRRFTGDASHQLRTPLTAMLGQLEVALRRDRPADDYRHTLRLAHGQALQLRQIVEMLLFLARADSEARLSNLLRIDLGAWLTDHLERYPDHPRRPDLRLQQSDAQPFWVRVQPPLLGQLVDNLLDNAWKYSRPGMPVTLHLGREPGLVTCTVEDAGCGIAAVDLPHVFKPFFRADAVRRQGCAGVGLGLAVVQRIAAAFEGSVRVQSEPGQGSRFTLVLPEAPGDTEPFAKTAAEQTQPAPAPATNGASGKGDVLGTPGRYPL
jgi:heavy metal sensor kinase